jgi:hypothetical protein
MDGRVSDHITFTGGLGTVETTVSELGPTQHGVGMRICVDLSAEALQAAYDVGAFDLPATIPGGDVPVPDTSKPVTLELRLTDEFESILADTTREPGVLLSDMVGLTQTGDGHLLLDPDSWQVATVRQEGKRRKPGLQLTTLHDSRPAIGATLAAGDDDPRPAAGSLAALIEAFVADEPGVEYISDATWRFPWTSEDGEFSVFVTAQDQTLICAATRIEAVPAHRIAEVRELVGDLNGEILTAAFDCERTEGAVSARAALDTAGVAVDSVLIGNIVGAAIEAMQRFLPAIDSIANGELNIADLRDAPDPDEIPSINLDTAAPEEVEAFLAEQFDD